MRTMRTQADRDFELELGRVMERRGAEIDRLRAEMARIEPAYEDLRATVNRLSDEHQCLRAEVARFRAALERIADADTAMKARGIAQRALINDEQ